jgi:hypothetical protein
MEDSEPRIAFAAFFTYLTLLWRDRNYEQYRDAVGRGRARFSAIGVFPGLEAQAASCSADRQHLLVGLDHAKRAVELSPSRAGILHTYASIVSSLSEMGVSCRFRGYFTARGVVGKAHRV